MKNIFFSLILLSVAYGSWAQSEQAGTTGFTFARLLFSPRASAMGSAYSGVSDDPEAVFFNPAGLFQLNNSTISAVYMNYLEGINCGSLIYTQAINDNITGAVYSRFLSTSETKTLSDEKGNYLGEDGKFGFSNIEAGFALSYHISNTLTLGGSTRLFNESIDGNSASAFALDLGIYHITHNENLHIGLALRNLGFQFSYFTESKYKENLPTLVDLGFGFRPMDALLLAADVYKPFSGDYSLRFGIEVNTYEILFLRLGYKNEASDWRTDTSSDALAGITGGFGLKWQNYQLDYAVMSYGALGLVNQIGIRYYF